MKVRIFSYLELFLSACLWRNNFSISYIKVNSSDMIIGNNHIDLYLSSFPVAVAGHNPIIRFFDRKHSKVMKTAILKDSSVPGKPRGIPPYNWVKFVDVDDNIFGLFSYKTINYCQQSLMPDSKLFDHISLDALRYLYKDNPEFFMARSMLGQPMNIHTLTTDAIEMYFVSKSFSNLTYLTGAHSDIRVLPFAKNCRYFEANKLFRGAKFIFAGAVNDHAWHDKQFIAVLDSNFDILFSKILVDPESRTRPQKNWLPFWDGCKLMFSKRFAPEHVVGEFTGWLSKFSEVDVFDNIKTASPAFVPSEYMVRGSSPPVSHPMFEPQYFLGCVHLRGKSKVYRHALYVMSNKYPYEILSFSPLFAFKPYRDIEFVMSIHVRGNGALELTHGSMDCEPRLAIFPIQTLEEIFREYMIMSN